MPPVPGCGPPCRHPCLPRLCSQAAIQKPYYRPTTHCEPWLGDVAGLGPSPSTSPELSSGAAFSNTTRIRGAAGSTDVYFFLFVGGISTHLSSCLQFLSLYGSLLSTYVAFCSACFIITSQPLAGAERVGSQQSARNEFHGSTSCWILRLSVPLSLCSLRFELSPACLRSKIFVYPPANCSESDPKSVCKKLDGQTCQTTTLNMPSRSAGPSPDPAWAKPWLPDSPRVFTQTKHVPSHAGVTAGQLLI